jgi:hypothetical protein
MNAAELEQRVRKDWSVREHTPNLHGLQLERNIVSPPCRKQFKNSFFQRDAKEPFRVIEHIDLWIVADETPGREGGYLIVFDERRDEYGVALKSGLFLGYYGSLAETIAGMQLAGGLVLQRGRDDVRRLQVKCSGSSSILGVASWVGRKRPIALASAQRNSSRTFHRTARTGGNRSSDSPRTCTRR